mmetsp:Transcript_8204/g.29881  ORF Transcript_8204/g.29881 Transcript_8204/m.29881 type:complete len:222 (+) Transcript_8204:4584-5249(+)
MRVVVALAARVRVNLLLEGVRWARAEGVPLRIALRLRLRLRLGLRLRRLRSGGAERVLHPRGPSEGAAHLGGARAARRPRGPGAEGPSAEGVVQRLGEARAAGGEGVRGGGFVGLLVGERVRGRALFLGEGVRLRQEGRLEGVGGLALILVVGRAAKGVRGRVPAKGVDLLLCAGVDGIGGASRQPLDDRRHRGASGGAPRRRRPAGAAPGHRRQRLESPR